MESDLGQRSADSPPAADTGDRLVCAALLILALTLRVPGFGEYWLNPDEAIYYHTIMKPGFMAMLQSTIPHTHPPLYYVLLWLFARLTADFNHLRLLSLMAGCLTVIPLYLTLRFVASRPFALGGALVYVFAPSSIVMAQVLRPYSLNLLFNVASLYFLTRITCSEPHHKAEKITTLFCVSSALAVLTHYASFIFVFACTVVCWALARSSRDERLKLILRALQPVYAALAFVVIINAQFTLSNTGLRTLKETGWNPLFLQSVNGIPGAFMSSLTFLFEPAAAIVILGLAIRGVFTIRFQPSGAAKLTAAGSLLLLYVFSLKGLYPAGGTRHVYPFMGAVLVFAFSGLGREAGARSLIAVIALPAVVWHLLLSPLAAPALFPVGIERANRASDMLEVASALQTPGEPARLLVDEQTFYVMRPMFDEGIETLSDRRVRWKGLEIVIAPEWRLGVKEGLEPELQRFAAECRQKFGSAGRELFLSAGWDPTSLLQNLEAEPILESEALVLAEL